MPAGRFTYCYSIHYIYGYVWLFYPDLKCWTVQSHRWFLSVWNGRSPSVIKYLDNILLLKTFIYSYWAQMLFSPQLPALCVCSLTELCCELPILTTVFTVGLEQLCVHRVFNILPCVCFFSPAEMKSPVMSWLFCDTFIHNELTNLHSAFIRANVT